MQEECETKGVPKKGQHTKMVCPVGQFSPRLSVFLATWGDAPALKPLQAFIQAEMLLKSNLED